VIGRTVLLDREPYDVIGVMGRAFESAYIQAELWTPLGLHDGNLPNPRSTYVQTVARLAPGATIAELDAEAVMAMEVIAREQPASHAGWKALAVDLREAQFGQQRAPLTVLLAAVVALALIACANLANLTLAHVLARRGELALRTAMGARRVDLLRLQAIETLVLAAAGGAAGVLAARWTLPVLLALDPATALILGAVPIDWRVLSATLALTLLVALFSGVLPVLRELRTDVARGLADGTRRAAGSRRDHRVGFTLVAAETGVAVLLLASSALLVNSFARAARTDPGFDPSGVVGAQLRLPSSGFPTEAARTMFTRQAADRLRAVPGVVDASTTLNLFVPGFTFQTLVHIEGRPTPDGQPHTVQFRRAGAGYFRTLRMPLLAGRSFDDGDALGSPRVAVVSRSFAERFWPGEDPVGRRIRRNTATLTVIGVVGDVSDVGFGQPPEATLYVSHAQESPAGVPVSLVVRAAGDPLALVPAIRAAIFSLDPALPIDKVTTLEAFLSASLGPERFRSTLLLVFGGLGLLLAAVGIYGVTARSVHERTREVGVRLALGADPVRIWCLVVRRAMAAVVLGLLCGSAAALAAGTLLVRLFPGLERAETWAPLPAVVALGLTALVAAALPARRALGVDPVLALRGE
jgi:putative ABC transport system permease protein